MRADLSDLERARLKRPGARDDQLVIELARRTLDELGLAPPISPEVVASMRGVARIDEIMMPWAGCLLREAGDLVIKVRASDGRGRRRFTAFHEIEHTYMPGFVVAPQYRCDPATPDAESSTRDRPLEALCDVGAAELLLPRSWFNADLEGNPPTIALVTDLAERYGASLEATAWRVVALRRAPTMCVVLELGCKPSAPRAEPRLRVQRVYASAGWPYLPRHKSVPNDSPLAAPLGGEVVDEVADLAGLTLEPLGGVWVSAAPFQYVDEQGVGRTRVIALLSRGRGGHGA
jgi:hypothetical protein